MFLIMLNYKKPIEIVEQYLAEHRSYLDQCYAQNRLIVSGPRNPRTGGVIISQLNDRSMVEQMVQNDPFYIHGVADFEVIEFVPVKYHSEFAKFV